MSRIYSQYSEPTVVTFAPAAPSGVKLNQIQKAIRLSWEDQAMYEDGFVIERKDGSGSWQTLYFSAYNRGYFDDYGPFTDGAQYTYRVKSYSILASQRYFFSEASQEVSVTYSYSDSLATETSISIVFGETESASVEISNAFRVYLEGCEEGVDYLWFSSNGAVSVVDGNSFASIIPLETGDAVVTARRRSDGEEAVLYLSVYTDKINQNPDPPVSIRGTAVNNSMIDILWNSESSDDLSHFDIYRIKRENTRSKNSLINYSDLSENRIASVPYTSGSSNFSHRDSGLISGTKYIYTVVAVNKYGLTSMFSGEERYDYVLNNSYSTVKTEVSDVDVDPPLAFVAPNSSVYLGVVNNTDALIEDSNWEIEQNTSNSKIEFEEVDFAYYGASDKTVSEDIVKLSVKNSAARSKIVVTETI